MDTQRFLVLGDFSPSDYGDLNSIIYKLYIQMVSFTIHYV